MRIHVSPLSQFRAMVDTHAPARIISLLDPTEHWPSHEAYDTALHLRVGVHDVTFDSDEIETPKPRHIDSILRFLEPWNADDPLYVHCWAGISRSSATAFIAACLANPGVDEALIARELREASHRAVPNERLVALADEALSRGGRMSAAIRAIHIPHIYVEGSENVPFSLRSRFA
jgi:predicted protein tyrosine phosphatase